VSGWNGLWRGCLALTSAVLLNSCAAQHEQPAPFQLSIAHINDHHSHLLPMQRSSINVNGETGQLETGGFARVVTQIAAIRQRHDNVLALHAGDAITSTLYYTLFNGAADAALMNQVCFDAFALGNHEFDNGDAGLKRFLDYLSLGDCDTAILAANVKPRVGVSPLTPKTPWDSFKPYAIFSLNGEKVGLIGLDIAIKTKQSSMPDATTEFADEYTTARYYIDELQRLGVGKIGLLTHLQHNNDLALAARLPAVDFIVGGDSHTLLGDYAQYGLPSAGPYPMQVNNVDGDPVCIAQAWQYSQVVGELLIEFTGDRVRSCGGQAHLLLALDAPSALTELPQFTAVAEDQNSLDILAQYQAHLDELTSAIVAQVDERICIRRAGVTNNPDCGLGRQSDAHRLVAEAFLASVPQADFSLQNGGGVRSEIAVGPLSIGDVYRILPFSNTLVEVQITGAELKLVLEQALTYAMSASGSSGAYPHGAGIQFDIDMTAADGQRVSELMLVTSNGLQAIVPEQTYTMVTNSFLATGADGWRLLADIDAAGRINDTYISYAQSFVDWLRKNPRVKRPTGHSTRFYRD
jgi:5'-nucleotidase / UDP-sugar diphosphatase